MHGKGLRQDPFLAPTSLMARESMLLASEPTAAASSFWAAARLLALSFFSWSCVDEEWARMRRVTSVKVVGGHVWGKRGVRAWEEGRASLVKDPPQTMQPAAHVVASRSSPQSPASSHQHPVTSIQSPASSHQRLYPGTIPPHPTSIQERP